MQNEKAFNFEVAMIEVVEAIDFVDVCIAQRGVTAALVNLIQPLSDARSRYDDQNSNRRDGVRSFPDSVTLTAIFRMGMTNKEAFRVSQTSLEDAIGIALNAE
ncbi:uncharacterized protein PHALS_10226 [Plasmopara halstedii]|uniref:Uncharacterized protein n=1 Tax=Plasmopara halstedii TaxID=4781 RepID=A0A0N7L4Y9_PLAHL|nr:uncharacterized protein PHALS_10226 [Plasmopara halstedii]CEG40003.1 hypothetical protein PHALS_10226 [Plasmopara halstedii]|eukprot:XP_024576372.1 hypothetical protein PHALS_10226 [Plasmopara halstedii]